MDATDFEFVLNTISDLISPKPVKLGGHDLILADERLALTLRYLATGESFNSLSYQFRISISACDIVYSERML